MLISEAFRSAYFGNQIADLQVLAEQGDALATEATRLSAGQIEADDVEALLHYLDVIAGDDRLSGDAAAMLASLATHGMTARALLSESAKVNLRMINLARRADSPCLSGIHDLLNIHLETAQSQNATGQILSSIRPHITQYDFTSLALRGAASPLLHEDALLVLAHWSNPQGYLHRTEFIDCIECGRFNRATELAETSPYMRDPIANLDWIHELELWLYLMQAVVSGRMRAVHDLLEESRTWQSNHAINVQLLAKPLFSRLSELRRFLQSDDCERFLDTSSNLLSSAPIRIALCIQDMEAARSLLGKRARPNKHSWVDDFFWVRYHLLRSEYTMARERMESLKANAQRFHSWGRLDFELRLSTEINMRQWYELIEQTAQPSGRTFPSENQRPSTALGQLRGKSRAIQEVRERVGRYAGLELPILVQGETGVGKELVARAIHEGRETEGDLPFVTLNCAAIGDSLLESELFGHSRGAFTGAEHARRGLLDTAGKGTLFLDEIGDTSLRFQVTLLRLLETGEYRPVGQDDSHTMECRIVAATNADLAALVERGEFRSDLLFRLQRLHIVIPPLRERRGDIVDLASYYLNQATGSRAQLTTELASYLAEERWLGNIRELRNMMEGLAADFPNREVYDVPQYQTLQASRLYGASLGTHAESAIKDQRSQNQAAAPKPAADTLEPFEGTSSGQPQTDDGVDAFEAWGMSPRERRLQQVRLLFRQHRRLTRKQITRALQVNAGTVTAYLKELQDEGLIRKVAPTASPRSHFFILLD